MSLHPEHIVMRKKVVANNDNREGIGKDADVTLFVQCSPSSEGREGRVPIRAGK